jgi:GNAT superfamily N-acetyltransferase
MDREAPATIAYGREPSLDADSFIDLLERSGLAERRPVADRPRIEAMLANASLIVTARAAGVLVGVARAVTDFSYCCYLSDLAVDRAWQGCGVGRSLLRVVRREAGGFGVRCILLSAPGAVGFYERAGLTRHAQCFDFTDTPLG